MTGGNLVRLDVGCGSRKQAGWVGMDARALPGVDIVHDIESFPWPLPDNSCSVILLSHVWEHIKPWRSIEVMDEMWRVLAPSGQLQLVMPYGWSHGYVMDPTHCNPANETTWEYFDPSKPLYEMYKPKPWRIAQVESQRAGNMLAVMEPIEKTGELGAFTLPPQDVHAWTDAEVASEFHRRWYNSRTREDSSSYCCNYGGRIIDKTPLDLWRYVEIIERVHPRVLIESGTANGASAQFFLDQMRRHLHPVEVISIDTDDGLAPFEQNPSRSNPGVRPLDDGIVYLLGSSTDKQIAMECRNRSVGRQTMVVLDSDHSCAHVELEMSVYWPLVSDGSYMVVEDSNINGNPVYPEYGPGPHEAVARWLPGHEDAFIDIEISRRFLGVSAHTWIKKVRT